MLIVVRIMCMLVVGIVIMVVLAGCLAEMAQGQSGQRLYRHARPFAALQHRREKAFHVRTDPVEQVGAAKLPYVGRSHRVMVRRGTRRQQNGGLANAVLNGSSDQLQRLDAGQHLDFSMGLGAAEKTGGH